MDDPGVFKSRRPGGRSLRVQSAVFTATLSVLAEQGYSGLAVDRIAEHAGVNKTTIYRRWQDKDTLLAAAMSDIVEQLLPIPAEGSIDDDLRAFGRGLVDFLTSESPRIAGLVRAMFSDAADRPAVAELKRNLLASRHQAAASMVQAAIERGELPDDADSREVVGLVAAQLYYRRFVTNEPLDYAIADRAAATAVNAARSERRT